MANLECTDRHENGGLSVEESRRLFDAWHLQLAVAVDATAFLFNQVEDERLASVSSILVARLENLLAVAPIPGGGTAGGVSPGYE